jgi:hypothetical protein
MEEEMRKRKFSYNTPGHQRWFASIDFTQKYGNESGVGVARR